MAPSGSSTVKLKKVVNGTATTLGSFAYNFDPARVRHRVRFRVEGSNIKASVWPDGDYDWDGSWDIAVTNTAVTTPGKLQLTHYYNGTGTERWIYLDDLTLYVFPEAGSHDVDRNPPPGVTANGKKVYLSPAQHVMDANRGCDGYSENEGARDIANRTATLLANRGYKVRIGQGRPDHNIASSNLFAAALPMETTIHIPIHSNAGTFDCEPPYGSAGTRVIYETTGGMDLAQEILNSLGPMSPGSPDALCTNPSGCTDNKDLDELTLTASVAAYVEMGFHTSRHDMEWMRDNRPAIAVGIADAIDRYFA